MSCYPVAWEITSICADFLVERRGFEPLTPAVQAPRARRLRRFQGLLPRAPLGPTLDRRRLHLPFAAQGRGTRHRRGSCREGGLALDVQYARACPELAPRLNCLR